MAHDTKLVTGGEVIGLDFALIPTAVFHQYIALGVTVADPGG